MDSHYVRYDEPGKGTILLPVRLDHFDRAVTLAEMTHAFTNATHVEVITIPTDGDPRTCSIPRPR